MTEAHLSDEQLHLHLDREGLDGTLRSHLGNCASCTERLRKIKQLHGIIGSVEEEVLQVDLSPRVLAAISQAQQARRQLGLIVGLEAVLALLVAYFVVPVIWEQYGTALKLLPDGVGVAAFIRESWLTVSSSISAFSRNVNFELLDSIAGYPWVWLISAAALLWLGGNGFMLRRLNRAE